MHRNRVGARARMGLGCAAGLVLAAVAGAASAQTAGWGAAPAPAGFAGFVADGASVAAPASGFLGVTGDVAAPRPDDAAVGGVPGLPVDANGAVDWARASDLYLAERRVRERTGRARGLVATGFDISVSDLARRAEASEPRARRDALR